MSKFDFSKEIAAGMDKVLNSEENKQLFSHAGTIEKLAFKRVADEDKPTEIEVEVQKTIDDNLNKEAQAVSPAEPKCAKCAGKYFMDKHPNAACDCACPSAEDCAKGCPCHSSPAMQEPSQLMPPPGPSGWGKGASVSTVVQNLLKVSDALDTLGFDKLAAATILLTDKLIVEAKAKKDSKSTKKDSKKDEKSKSKSKMSKKERMKKLQDAKKKKSSKSSK